MGGRFGRLGVSRVDPDDKLSVVEHLTELRKRLFIAVLALVVAFAVLYVFNEWLLDILLDPLAPEDRQRYEYGEGRERAIAQDRW